MELDRYCKKNTRWLSMAFLMGLTYLWHGYQFGRNDQTEWLPYALEMADQTLYQQDLYIQHVTGQSPNERWTLAKLISFTVPQEPIGSFIFHFMALLILLNGLWEISSLFIQRPLFKMASILLLMILFLRTSVGGNEIYYNYLVSSLPAKALGTYAIFFMMRQKWIIMAILLSMATFLQAIVGIQLFLILFGAALLYTFIKKQKFTTVLLGAILYLMITGWFIVLLFFHTNIEADISLFELFRYRVPHHYFPSTYGLQSFVCFGLLSIVVLWIAYQFKYLKVSLVLLPALFGILIYTIAVEVFHSELILKAQWYKTTIWIELFAAVLIAAYGEKLFVKYNKLSVAYGGFIGGLAILLSFHFIVRKPMLEFPWKKSSDLEIEAAKAAQKFSDKNEVFVIPFSNSTFRYWSRRNLYVDFKSVLHSPTYLNTWIQRIEEIYGLTISQRPESTAEKSERAGAYYFKLPERTIQQLDAHYFMTKPIHLLNFDIAYQNKDWIIYRIPN